MEGKLEMTAGGVKERVRKRDNYLSWDEAFMGLAGVIALRSKDPSTQVGAVIVGQDKRVKALGYNGFPSGCSDDEFPWDREAEDPYDSKYIYVAHAELNAVLNGNGEDLRGCTIYVSLSPCAECAKALIQVGIREVVFQSDKYAELPSFRAARRMFAAAGVEVRQFNPARKEITIRFE